MTTPIRAIKLFVAHMADACLEGQAKRKDSEEIEAKAEEAPARPSPRPTWWSRPSQGRNSGQARRGPGQAAEAPAEAPAEAEQSAE